MNEEERFRKFRKSSKLGVNFENVLDHENKKNTKNNFFDFDNSSNFPVINNAIVYSAKFETCKENKLTLKIVKVIENSVENGIVKNAWWIIITPNLPDRFVNLYSGLKSLERLLKNYGFSDTTGCVHYKKGKLYTVEKVSDIEECTLNVPKSCQNILGIPQRVYNSGICWYAATCFAFFYCDQMRNFLTSKMKDTKLVDYCNQCLKSSEISERLREKLWYDYAFGDKIGQNPEWDGQNGLSQFCIIASKLDIPVLRFFVSNEKIVKLKDPVYDQKRNLCKIRDKLQHVNEKHILVIRFYKGDHHTKFKPMRRFYYCGRKYKLCSMLLGSMHCGHQIGASCYNLKWDRWAVSDSDASMFGIGPVHFHTNTTDCKQKEKWWSHWRHMIPLTIFGSQKSFCDLSPHNRPTGEFENKSTVSDVGDLNLDLIYVSF